MIRHVIYSRAGRVNLIAVLIGFMLLVGWVVGTNFGADSRTLALLLGSGFGLTLGGLSMIGLIVYSERQ